MEVCQLLWTQQRAAYDAPELAFDGIHQMPKPLQAGGIPVWISGTVNKRVARRLSRFGTRWIPWGSDIVNLEESIPAMKQAIADVGGDPTNLEVQGSAALKKRQDGGIDVDASVASVANQIAAGATDIRFGGTPSTGLAHATEQLSDLVAAFRDVTQRNV